jgi:hypothetical protein
MNEEFMAALLRHFRRDGERGYASREDGRQNFQGIFEFEAR